MIARTGSRKLMWDRGLRRGDHVAILMENHLAYFDVVWAAMRSGLYLTTVNRYLTGEEADYIVDNSESQVLVTSRRAGRRGRRDQAPRPAVHDLPDGREPSAGSARGNPSHEESRRGRLRGFRRGDQSLPGRGGWRRSLPGLSCCTAPARPGARKASYVPCRSSRSRTTNPAIAGLLRLLWAVDENTVYLSPAPLYHSAPIGFCQGMQAVGGTVVMMHRFDPVQALGAIEKYRVTHSQWVPTMFTRMLKLPEEERTGFDLSSHKVAIHAAAPCPPAVKHEMLDWWGPILYEYYAGTELNGFTHCGPEEWLAHPGTVGKALLGVIHICDEDGAELPAGEPGIVYFEMPALPFEYLKDPGKTKDAQHPDHANWTALGRRRLSGRRGLPVPDRPRHVHDHLRRREHLPAGNRRRDGDAPESGGCGGHWRPQPRDGRGSEGGRATSGRGDAGRRVGGRASRLRARAHRALQVPEERGLPRRAAEIADGENSTRGC